MILLILTDENEIGCKPRASGDDPHEINSGRMRAQ